MKFYLSSFRMGSPSISFRELKSSDRVEVAYIPNAIDYIEDLQFRDEIITNDFADLNAQGLNVTTIDLVKYFGKRDELEDVIRNYDYIWVTGGNSFVLNQAFKLSGFDNILRKMQADKTDIVYGGFSCATYVIGPTLEGYEKVDDPESHPYGEHSELQFDGVGLIDYCIVPHFKSDHFEAEAIDDVVEYMKSNERQYKTIKDGEVIIIS